MLDDYDSVNSLDEAIMGEFVLRISEKALHAARHASSEINRFRLSIEVITC